MNTPPRIVVTGFEPFGSWPENPTLAVLAQLRALDDIAAELTTLELPVDSTRIAALAADALETIRPDVWISLGLAAGLAVIAVERIAANVLDFAIPDNAGLSHQDRPVLESGQAAHFATLPVRAITDALCAEGIPAKLSNSASTYLCNQLMYSVLHHIAEQKLATRAGFLHVPAHPALAALQTGARADMPSMSVDLMTAAVKLAIRTTLGVARSQPLQR